MTEAHLFALGIALAALSGVRAYLTVFGVGLAGLLGWVDLPPALAATTSPWVLATAGSLTVIEFTFDKIPGVDSGWDLVQTLLRVPVGAFLAAATLSPDGQLSGGALAIGASAALLTHAVKTGTRALINTSPEPMSNWTASVGEDVVTAGGLAIVFAHPWLALSLILGVVLSSALLVLWLARKVLRLLSPRTSAG
ncbi:DUF4126 domain-containing protein [Arenimonas oryziterrae]|uniref:DUF4126 domain-containing protein n=1 Tax=Arenimonas oryziterrae DSM 21050 = YC6267 TaxID=1121015 RepID=A0A091BDE4_9GAMM|nr:DUF4126 domain-containing protein [Arenimonas oryziterrae]KFN42410.1 hypothetical protein N789_13720 [Arenimonas oryziterrae DSM 21050 = YC6267]